MGDDKSSGTPAPQPQPPSLPETAPKELRDFVGCTADSYAFTDGPLTWIDVKPRPNMAIKPGLAPGSGTIELKAMGLTIALPATVANGELAIDTSNQFFLPKSAEDEIQRFVDGLNAWFLSNGKQLAPPTFGAGRMTLTKVAVAAGAGTGPAAAAGAIVLPTPVGPPVKVDAHPSPHAGGSPAPMPYLETKVEPPPLPKGEAFGPYSRSSPPPPLEDVGMGSASPVTGAMGPGGPKAPAGMGNLARYALIAAVLAGLAVSAFVFLGPPQPAVPGPTKAPSAPPSGAPAATVVPPSLAATAAPGSTPNGVANGRFEIVSDVKVTSCHHDYEVAFRVFDSSGDGAVYAGKPVTFQVLDGEVLTATAGPDGTWTSTVAEDFQKTNSGCFSRLNPKVLTVDGQPAF